MNLILLTLIITVSLLVIIFPTESFSHQDGCHRWHSCPSDSGSYTCGDTGHCSECPDNNYCKAGKPYTEKSSSTYVPPKTSESIQPVPKSSDYSESSFSTKVEFDGSSFIPSKISTPKKIFLKNTSESSMNITIKSYHTIGSQAFAQEDSLTLIPDRVKTIQIPIPISDPILSQIVFISDSGSVLVVDNQGEKDFRIHGIQSEFIVPSWVKNVAKWWADDITSKEGFVNGVRYLIDTDVIHVKTTIVSSNTSQDIPQWIKNTAKWWAQGNLSDEEFVSGIEWMIENGVMSVYGKDDSSECTGNAMCLEDIVQRVIDGDTLIIGEHIVRLSLVDTPEREELGFNEATAFTSKMCTLGKTAILDQDDLQPTDRYDRVVGKVTCSGINLNESLLTNNHGKILTQYCMKSEFKNEPWAKQFGC